MTMFSISRREQVKVSWTDRIDDRRLVLTPRPAGVLVKAARFDSATRFTATDCPPTETCLSKANQIQMSPTRTVVTRTRLSNFMRTITRLRASCWMVHGASSMTDRWRSFRQRNRFKLDKMAQRQYMDVCLELNAYMTIDINVTLFSLKNAEPHRPSTYI